MTLIKGITSGLSSDFPVATVHGYEEINPGFKLRDEKDMHVVQAAIQSSSQVIVTQDKGFENKILNRIGISAMSADDFINMLTEINLTAVAEIIILAARKLMRDSYDLDEFIKTMESERHGMVHTAHILKDAMEQ